MNPATMNRKLARRQRRRTFCSSVNGQEKGRGREGEEREGRERGDKLRKMHGSWRASSVEHRILRLNCVPVCNGCRNNKTFSTWYMGVQMQLSHTLYCTKPTCKSDAFPIKLDGVAISGIIICFPQALFFAPGNSSQRRELRARCSCPPAHHCV